MPWLITGLAVLLRVAAILVLGSYTAPDGVAYTYEHGTIAENLVAGRGFSIELLGGTGPTSQQAPVYPALLALCYLGLGSGTTAAVLAMQLLQAVCGGALVFVTINLVRRVVPERPCASLIAGSIVAIHPTLIYSVTHIQVASWAALGLTTTLYLAYRANGSERWIDLLLTGFALGVSALTDPILALAAPAVAWILLGPGVSRPRGRLIRVGTVALTATLVVAPWLVRNAAVHGEFVAIKSTFGYAFWQGNCALSKGTDKVVRSTTEAILAEQTSSLADAHEALWRARHEAGYIDDIALSSEDKAALGRLSEPERARVLFRRALEDLRADPSRYPELCLRRLRYFILFDETNPKTRNLVYRTCHLGLTCLAALGVVLAGRDQRHRLSPTFLVVGLIALFHSLTIVSARFHIPIEPLMAAWAGIGLATRLDPTRSAPDPQVDGSVAFPGP